MRLFLLLATAACVFSSTLKPEGIFDSDTLWHIKAGEWILAQHAVPLTDPFSWSAPGAPWVAHEWLFEAALAVTAKAGPLGIAIFSTVLIMAGLFGYWKLLQLTTPFKTTAALFYLFALLLIQIGWTARPQIAGYAFFITTLYLLYAGRNHPAKLWLLPPLFLLWANCHASVILGLGVVGLETALSFVPEFEAGSLSNTRRDRKKLVSVLLSSLLASFANPHGVGLWLYAFKVSSDPVYKAITEWQPPVSLSFTALIFLILAIAAVFMAARKNKLDLLLFILALLTLFGTMTSIRHFVYFVLVWVLLLARSAGELALSRKMVSILGFFLAILFAVKISGSGWPGNDPRVLAEKAGWPVKAVDWLEAHQAKKVFNHYNWGGYLIYRGLPVYMDGRADMYHMAGTENDAFTDYINFLSFKEPPENILEKYEVNYVLIQADALQVSYLKKFGWQEFFNDEKSVVLERSNR